MQLEETENLKLQDVNNIQTTTSQKNHIHDSDNELAEKIIQILNIYEKNPNLKGKPSFEKMVQFCRRYGDKNQKQHENLNKPQKYREPNKSSYQYLSHFQTATIIIHNNQLNEIIFAEDLQKKRSSQNFLQNRYCRSNSQNNQYRIN